MDEYDMEIKRILGERNKDEWLKARGIDDDAKFRKLRKEVILFSLSITFTIMVLSILQMTGVWI